MAIGKTRDPTKTYRKYRQQTCYNPQTEQHLHAYAAPSVDCNIYLQVHMIKYHNFVPNLLQKLLCDAAIGSAENWLRTAENEDSQ